MAAKKKVDPIKQREKRAKIAAIGGVVLLLAVAAWQGPKMMKLMNQKPVVPPTSAAAPAGTSALPGTGAPTTTTASGELADTDVPPAALDGGQLVSFDVFQTKDPFRPQVTSADVAAADAAASGATATQSAPGTGSRRRVVRDDASLDRGAIDDDTGDHRRTLDAGGAEHSGDHHDRQARRADRLDLRQRSDLSRRARRCVPEQHARLPARLLDEGRGKDRHRRRLVLDGRPDARADHRQAGHPAEHEQRPAVQARPALHALEGGGRGRSCR